jgi:adenylate kinase family enzyme
VGYFWSELPPVLSGRSDEFAMRLIVLVPPESVRPENMSVQRVVILGRDGAGKSTVARRLGEAFGLPVIELDKHFWQSGLVPLPKDQWAKVQQEMTNQPRWVIDGDLGPYDVFPVRLSAAGTVLLLDFSMWLCLWRALRRAERTGTPGGG